MIDVTNLGQHILSLEPANNAARLSFYNFLKNLCDAGQPITAQLINSFYSRALTFSHWQENRTQLFEQTQVCLLSYAKATPDAAETVLSELQKSWQADEVETVLLKNQANLLGLVSHYLEKQ